MWRHSSHRQDIALVTRIIDLIGRNENGFPLFFERRTKPPLSRLFLSAINHQRCAHTRPPRRSRKQNFLPSEIGRDDSSRLQVRDLAKERTLGCENSHPRARLVGVHFTQPRIHAFLVLQSDRSISEASTLWAVQAGRRLRVIDMSPLALLFHHFLFSLALSRPSPSSQ